MLQFISMTGETPLYIGTSKRYIFILSLASDIMSLTNLQLNVLISSTGEALLSDFVLAFIMGKSNRLLLSNEEHSVGTLRYMAPELVREGRNTAGKETDIWALAMTLLEVGKSFLDNYHCIIIDSSTRNTDSSLLGRSHIQARQTRKLSRNSIKGDIPIGLRKMHPEEECQTVCGHFCSTVGLRNPETARQLP